MTTACTSERPSSNTKTIARNSIFIGLETAMSLLSVLATTVAVARVIGPTRLGYYSLVMWMTSITCSVGSVGIPLTTFRYMAEFRGAGRHDLVRAVFSNNFRLQSAMAAALSAVGLAAVFVIGAPQCRTYSILLVLSIIPNMMAFIPSQANNAAENLARNAQATFVSTIIQVVLVLVSLAVGWDLIGVAAALLLSRIVELGLKLVPVMKSMAGIPAISLPRDIRRRMFNFSGFSTALLLVQIIVWDRSDLVLLKMLQPDIKQVAFFSVCFSIADRLLRVPQTFGSALSVSLMAEYGRDKARMFRMTGQSALYVLLGALPVAAGMAAVASPLIRVVYGQQYLRAIPVFIVVSIFAIPRAVLVPAQTLLYSAEDLAFLLKWTCLAGAANLVFDVALIPHHGAVGAAFGNGIAQAVAAAGVWSRVIVRHRVTIDTRALLRLLAAGLAMVLVAIAVVAIGLRPVPTLAIAVPLGAITFAIAIRVVAVLHAEDRKRLLLAVSSLPASLRLWCNRAIDFVVPPGAMVKAAGAGSISDQP